MEKPTLLKLFLAELDFHFSISKHKVIVHETSWTSDYSLEDITNHTTASMFCSSF